jgi:hypothetical protein
MAAELLPTEIIVAHPRQSLGKVYLDWMPQPGNYLEFAGQVYAVLERHHHYQYKIGGYCLTKISLQVCPANASVESGENSGLNREGPIGDVSCRFNARSELIRCAVNPSGPCQNCHFFEAITP